MKKENYPEFRETLKKREMKTAPRVRKLLRSSYQRVSDAYSHSLPAEQIADNFIEEDDWTQVYRQIYKDIYVGMGVWNARLYLQKKTLFQDVLLFLQDQSINEADKQLFIKRQLIFSANRNAIIKAINTLRDDPTFLNSHEDGASRLLMREFRELSKNQARMIVRTEATNAANRAILASTQKIFPNRILRKEWISAKDGRTRTTHRQADGQKVLMSGQFFVGGELIDHPGAGVKPENNIYCRCAVTPVR